MFLKCLYSKVYSFFKILLVRWTPTGNFSNNRQLVKEGLKLSSTSDTQILISNCAMVFTANEKRETAILSSLQVTRPRFQKSINLWKLHRVWLKLKAFSLTFAWKSNFKYYKKSLFHEGRNWSCWRKITVFNKHGNY